MCENTNKKELPYSTMKMFLDPRLKLIDKTLYVLIHYLLLTENQYKTTSLSKEYIRYKSGLNMFKFNHAWRRLKEAGYLVVERSYDHTNNHTVFLFTLKGTSCVKNMDIYLELIAQFDKAYWFSPQYAHSEEVIRKARKVFICSQKFFAQMVGVSFDCIQSWEGQRKGSEPNTLQLNMIKLIAASKAVQNNLYNWTSVREYDNFNKREAEDAIFLKSLESGLHEAVKVDKASDL